MTQNFFQYFSSTGNKDSTQKSGAYIFRPNQYSADPMGLNAVLLGVVRGPHIQEIRQNISSGVTQVVRLIGNESFAEFEWTVGPVDVSDGWGKEVVSRFSTSLASSGVFYTDSNGREMLKRTRDHQETYDVVVTEPVAQNYYPVNTAIYLEDGSTRMTVLTDRSQGGSSMGDGELELMVNRRTLNDDDRGVAEPINEPGIDGNGLIVRGRHWLIIAPVSSSPQLHKSLNQRLTYEPITMFSSFTSTTTDTPTHLSLERSTRDSNHLTAMTVDFPPNVHLLSKQLYNGTSLHLVRVNHLYQTDEDATLSTNASVYLADVFPGQTISKIEEVNLSANQAHPNTVQSPTSRNNYQVTLSPMEIRSFKITLA
jgi:lysosomal alpha-mannosidase